MRHIERLPIPQILIDKQVAWQEKYNEKLLGNSKARPDSTKYGHKKIREQLNRSSFNKCFYCESLLVGAPKEIDHYVEVAIDSSLAYEWTNLYLSCNSCNDKLDHSIIPVTEVLNPCVDSDEEIRRHITFEKEYIRSYDASEKGHKTIQKFKLSAPLLDLKRSKWLNKISGVSHEIHNRMIGEKRILPTEEEKEKIRKFMQKDQPYSLMSEIYIKDNMPWALE